MDQPAPTPHTEQSGGLSQYLAEGLSPAAVEPIMAGMRARAVADACERSGLAAVLIDAGGRVLHVASHAKAVIGHGIDLVAGHLIGRTRADNVALQGALNAALTEGEVMSSDASGEMSHRVTGLPYRDASPYQVLRGVLIFSAPHECPDVPALRVLLSA